MKRNTQSNQFSPLFLLESVLECLSDGRTSFTVGPLGSTSAALCFARCENELFCFAFKRALPDVIQVDIIVMDRIVFGLFYLSERAEELEARSRKKFSFFASVMAISNR